MKLLVADLGTCAVNYQKEYIIEELKKHFQFTKNIEEAEIVLMLGSCCCTEVQLKNTLSLINYFLENKQDNAKTYLTGCITRNFKDIPKLKKVEYYLKENIDYIISHYKPNELLKLICENTFKDLEEDSYGLADADEESASLLIQNGCLNNCTFCKSNYLNCNLIDTPLDRVKRAIDKLDESKIKKVELRGLNISQYGLGLYHDYKLIELCEYIEGKSNIEKIELSNFAFSDAIKNNFVNRLKHLEKLSTINGSLESGSNRILKLMNKGFTKEEFLDFYYQLSSIYKKDYFLNIISGFPTETIDDCLETINVLKEINPKLVNINTYLDSEFIPSHNLENLTQSEIRVHTKIYSKVLKNNSIKYVINGAN